MVHYNEIIIKEEKHTYLISFVLSFVAIGITLFYTPSMKLVEPSDALENIRVINIDKIAAPKRIVKKAISTEKGEPTTEQTVERARGTSLEETAVDMAFFPNIAPPRLIGKLKRIYPKIAKEQSIEAILNTVILISADGKVLRVNVVAVRLSKSLPPEIYGIISAQFSNAAVKMLLGQRYTPPIVEGKRVPIKMEQRLNFKLDV